MKKLICLVFLLSACSNKEEYITLAEATQKTLYGTLDLTSNEDPITKVSFHYYNKNKTIDLNVDSGTKFSLTIPVPKLVNYRLMSMTISTREGQIFLSFSDQCKTINDMPIMLRFYGDNYGKPALMVPHLKSENHCFHYPHWR